MAIEAKLSKYKRNNRLITIFILVAVGAWFAYDGYVSEKFQEKHTTTNEDGEQVPDSDLVFNRTSPPFFLAGAIVAAIWLFLIKGKKVIASDTALVTEKLEIKYDDIEQINKTNFDSKGFFIITYKNEQGSEQMLRFSDRTYDNLPAVLDAIVKKIT